MSASAWMEIFDRKLSPPQNQFFAFLETEAGNVVDDRKKQNVGGGNTISDVAIQKS